MVDERADNYSDRPEECETWCEDCNPDGTIPEIVRKDDQVDNYSDRTPEPSLWDEELTITRGELGTMLDALQMLEAELNLLELGGYQPPKWLQELHAKALGIARRKRDTS